MAFILPWSEPIVWANPLVQETVFLVIRHGETFGNDPTNENEYTMTGCRTNFPLNISGQNQAERIAKKISSLQKSGKLKISAIYSSPLKRAIETAGFFSQELGLPVVQRPDLKEIDWGEADGKLVQYKEEQWGESEKQIRRQIADRKKRWDYLPAIPQAEKYNQLLNRVIPEFEQLGKACKGNIVIVVTHGRVLKTLIADRLDMEDKDIPYPQNCGIAVFRYSDGESLQFVEVRENK